MWIAAKEVYGVADLMNPLSYVKNCLDSLVTHVRNHYRKHLKPLRYDARILSPLPQRAALKRTKQMRASQPCFTIVSTYHEVNYRRSMRDSMPTIFNREVENA
jgi:folate-dependent tRNA-U54 methylase TrmFO/GidA